MRRSFGVAATCVALAGSLVPAARAAEPAGSAAVPQFPGVRSAPDPGNLNYGGWFKAHQPVRIVFGVGDPALSDLKETLVNVARSIQYLQLKHITYRIEIVLYGSAVKAADPMSQKFANLSDLMRALHGAGVEFDVCYNSMADVGMHRGDIYSYMKLVPAGVLEIVRREAQGYAYIRNF